MANTPELTEEYDTFCKHTKSLGLIYDSIGEGVLIGTEDGSNPSLVSKDLADPPLIGMQHINCTSRRPFERIRPLRTLMYVKIHNHKILTSNAIIT